MGIYDREYYREDRRQPPATFGTSTVAGWSWTKRLIVLNVAVTILQAFSGDHRLNSGITPYLMLDSTRPFEVWRLLTADFCHSMLSPLHIIANMWALWLFGTDLERRLGGREYIVFYLLAGIAGSLAFLGFHTYMQTGRAAVGASGAVMGVFAAYAVYYPNREFLLFFILPMKAWMLLVLFMAWDLWPFLGWMMGGPPPNTGIAHTGHLGGLFFGLLYVRFGWRLSDRMKRPKLASMDSMPSATGSRWKVLERDPEPPSDLDKQVDHILAKIKSAGEESLTDEERKILAEASKVYRDRQR